jgi:hypothetical protein
MKPTEEKKEISEDTVCVLVERQKQSGYVQRTECSLLLLKFRLGVELRLGRKAEGQAGVSGLWNL